MRAPCATGEVIQGFTPVLFPICLDLPIAISNYLGTNIGGIIRDYLATNVATSTGNVLTGFNLTGDAVYASGISSQWKSGFLPGSIYYSSGNVGIGAIP